MKLEKEFEQTVVKEIQERLPGAYVFKLDPNSTFQGIPDRLILWNNRYALLEFKRAANSARQPNQEYYVRHFNELSFSSFIHPGNKEEVLDALCRSFGA